MTIKEATEVFIRERTPYFKQWLFDEPLCLPPGEDRRFRRLQQLLHKVIVQFVTHYDRYADLMPVDTKVRRIIEVFSAYDYTPGTYRTDFIEDATGQIKIIEITCRFALNGYFGSSIFNRYAKNWIDREHPGTGVRDYFSPIFDRFDRMFGSRRSTVVLHGADRRNESKLFTGILQQAGIPVISIAPREISANTSLLMESVVVNELSFDELCSLPPSDWVLLARAGIINDLRTVFLIHDKRFFGVMQQDELLKDAFSASEAREFRTFCVPTLTDQTSPERWAKAVSAKDDWVLKPRDLGKSIDVQVGRTVGEDEWRSSLAARPRRDLILQEWIERPRHRGTVNGVPHEDYAVGTALFWDQDFYGLAEYRMSSHPVTSKVDHRKLSSAFMTGTV